MYALLINLLAWIRLVQILPWPIAVMIGAHFKAANPRLIILSFGVQTTWSLFFALRAIRTKTLPGWVVLIDVFVASACLLLADRGWAANSSMSWGDSTVYPAVGVALSVAVAWWLWRAIVASTLLAVFYFIGVRSELHNGGSVIVTAAGNILWLIGITIVAGVVSNQLITIASASESSRAAILQARERAAAQQARYEERKAQYRILHDTVLSTLNAIARGVECDPGFRQRCAAEADLIRNMISHDAEPLQSLAIELALVAHYQAALGLRVHCQTADIPEFLPPEVIAAITGSCREALNNVAKHAGTGEAWVTSLAGPDEGGVTVTIVDRGNGFDPGSLTPGHGLNYSIAARMAEVRGTSEVTSEIGEGTSVVLKWPK